MRIATARHGDRIVFGPIDDHGIRDVSAVVADQNALMALVHTSDGRAQVAGMAAAASSHPLDEVVLLPPVPSPRRIMCVGTNYADHVAESDRIQEAPPFPVIFTRFASSLVGAGEHLERPSASTSYDYEGELAIVIGAVTRNVSRDDAMGAIAGYSCFMDGTLRDYQRHTSQFIPGKNFERSGAFGPWVVTADEIDDPHSLELTTRVNGEVMQHASTSQLIHDIARIIEYCSIFTTLEPGDVIATGTPGGVGYAKQPPLWLVAGSTVTVSIDGVGSLTNTVIDSK